MEATTNTLDPCGVGDPKYSLLSDEDATGTHDELKYVDNSLKTREMIGNVSSTGEVYHDVVQKSCSDTSLKARDKVPENEDLVNPSKTVSKCSSNTEAKKCTDDKDLLKFTSELHLNENVNNCLELGIHEICTENQEPNSKSAGHILPMKDEPVDTSNGNEDLQYTDIYLSRTSESDDDDDDGVIVLSDNCVPCLIEDESHYITTHGIQLSELSDHELDNNIEVGSCWDIEADNQMYSFVDYASFDCDETRDMGETVQNKQGLSIGRIASSVLENDIIGKATCNSSEWLGKCNGNSGGQIHLSIKTTSRAINEPSNFQQNKNLLHHAKHAEDVSRYVFRGADAKADRLCDDAKCFIAAPGRLHFGSKLKGKDVNEYSSSASSAVSELDDADKEVRNLTDRAFKSLAYPYFNSINFCTSSESSASERGLGINKWSTFVDLKYGNISQGRGQNSLSHKMSSCTMAKKEDNQGCKGGALTKIKSPPSTIFNFNGNPHNAAAKQKIAVMGKFGQGHSGVITLTETLNFRCNVKSGVAGGERRSKCVQNAAGSRSTDEVTNASTGGQGSETRRRPCNARETMEDTHKKAIFASSLLKNVISKKIQFEQERKMERGEICEPYQVPSPCFAHQDLENPKENVPTSEFRDMQGSKYSKDDSDYTIVCVQELGDIVDSSSCDTKCGSGRHASCTELESANEVGFNSKKGAFEVAKSTLLRSQNSAFRSWRDGELEFQKERKNDKTPEWTLSSTKVNFDDTDLCVDSGTSKLSKMSLLYVPSIQLPSSEREVDNQLQIMNYSTRAPTDQKEGGGMLAADSSLYVPRSTRTCVTSKSPEIKIKLKKMEDNKSDKFNISKCPISNQFCNGANLIKTADDSRCHALAPVLKGESYEKVPHFMVRDIRDRKGKLQTPIHQVRDVRKLVKSSYHFLSLDNNDNKFSAHGADLPSEQRIQKHSCHKNRASVSPIVIKCQSVNTNSNFRVSENVVAVSKCELNENTFEIERSSPEDSSLIHGPTEIVPFGSIKKDLLEGHIGLRIETRPASMKQEKTPDITVKNETKMANKTALEKLQAAVKTMEQLYVFDRNEWKRKSNPITESHVLSLVTKNELDRRVEEDGHFSNTRPTSITEKLEKSDSHPSTDESSTAMASYARTEIIKDTKPTQTFYIPHSRGETNGPKLLSQQGGGTGSKNMYLSSNQNTSMNTTASIYMNTAQSRVIPQAPYSTQGFCTKSPKVPVSLKISQARYLVEDSERPLNNEAGRPVTHTETISSAVPENYLTIPFKSHATSAEQIERVERSAHGQASDYNFSAAGTSTQTSVHPPERMSHADALRKQEERRQSPNHEAQHHDTPTTTIYHHSLPMPMSSAQHQVICFSPTMPPLPTIDHFQATQRKMLLDPTTGNYYLVDTPVQPATKRLFDPETGQYVDVPMPQPPMTPMPMPMPMPMPISPLALSPGAFGHSYMMYPGFMSTPTVIPARTIPSQMSMNSEADNGSKGSHSQQSDGVYVESPYYMATGKSPLPQRFAKVSTPHGFINDKSPVINLTSQQGPRIIAPPSFDGTTMSFVVEHR